MIAAVCHFLMGFGAVAAMALGTFFLMLALAHLHEQEKWKRQNKDLLKHIRQRMEE